MGAKYGSLSVLSEKSYEKLKKENLNFNASASGSVNRLKINENSLSAKEKEDINKFSKER